MKHKHLSIDIETFSDVDIGKCGLFKYVDTEAFEILLFAYSYDFGPVHVVDMTKGEIIPADVLQDLADPGVIKHAYNAAFEITCLNRAGYRTPPDQWRCTMLHGLYLGYPAGLANLGKALGLPEDKRKMAAGKALIRYFCVPCKATKKNGGRTTRTNGRPLKPTMLRTSSQKWPTINGSWPILYRTGYKKTG